MKNDNVNRPRHYRKGSVECIDAIKSALGNGYQYYLQGNVIKYVVRYLKKNKIEDLNKIKHYCDLEIDRLRKEWDK